MAKDDAAQNVKILPWRVVEKFGVNVVWPSGGDRLYHYTSADGLKGILESKSLWASEDRNLNNDSEIGLGLDLALETLENDDRLKFTSPLVAPLLKDVFQEFAAFVVCFTTRRDLLSQWRAYGDDGRGYCLGFDIREMTCRVPGSGRLPVLGPVIYGKNKGRNILRELATEYWNSILPELKEWSGKPEAEQEAGIWGLQRRIGEMVMWLATVCALIKHESFAEEHEIRALYVCRLDAMEDQRQENRSYVIKARDDGRGCFIPYVELGFTKSQSLLEYLRQEPKVHQLGLVEIILPPQSRSIERARRGLVALLRQHSNELEKVDILESEVSSYRS